MLRWSRPRTAAHAASVHQAAASDGHLDPQEQDRVFSEASRLNLTQEDKAKLFDELRFPLSMQQIVAMVRSPEMAIEVYTASLIAIDENRPAGEAYLRSLAMTLDLPPELVASVHAQVDAAAEEPVAA